ncbi:putative oxidoreductase [Amycolatopsis lexingtonensis]|uniref:Oxidoreductase n=1 Tax=Amycolatopsis lexingtonensis TaxID=218822 RepID=A0ABR9HT20_9PSEU|nr:DoxX family protein [Amycolatopsis lexingtonensis]MBE1494069.1 putative oxidoreductase [Amycolatopsis lexingtonensis]
MLRLDPAREHVVGLYRIAIGFLFACHGLKSLFGLFGANAATPVAQWPGWWAAAIQLVCGGLVLIGVATRPAAVLGSGSMAYAYFTAHSPHGLWPIQNGGEAAALFCWALLLVAFVGPGRFALSRLWSRPEAGNAPKLGSQPPVTAARSAGDRVTGADS